MALYYSGGFSVVKRISSRRVGVGGSEALLTDACSAIHAKRVTIMQKDIQLARRIRGAWGGMG